MIFHKCKQILIQNYFSDDKAILVNDQSIDNLFIESNKIINTEYAWFYKNKFKLNLS